MSNNLYNIPVVLGPQHGFYYTNPNAQIPIHIMKNYYRENLKGSGIVKNQFYGRANKLRLVLASDELAMQEAVKQLKAVEYKNDFENLLK
jgi:hypothetical protein